MGREQRNQAVGIRILDDKQRLTGIVSRMNLNKCMIVIQEKSILVLGIQIIRCIQRISRVRKIIRHRYCFFLRLREILYAILRPVHIDTGLQGSLKILRHRLHAVYIIRVGETSHTVRPGQKTVICPQTGPMMIRAIIDGFLCVLLQSMIHIYIVIFSDGVLYFHKQSFLVIIGCKCRQFIRENIVRRRHQHHLGIPVVHQLC